MRIQEKIKLQSNQETRSPLLNKLGKQILGES